MADYSVTANLARHHERQVGRIVDSLRRLADNIERRLPVPTDTRDGKQDFLGQAREIEHTLRWGYSNLPIESLLSAATDADRWVRSPEAD